MTSPFVSVPPASDASPPATPSNDTVAGDGWYPDVDLAALRATVRIDTTVLPERLREAVRNAMISVADDLDAWRAPLELTFANLAAVTAVPGPDGAPRPVPSIGGRSKLLVCYDRAICGLVAADLAERLQDTTATAAGQVRAVELATPADEHRRNARWAVRDLLGKPRSTIELI